MKNKTITITADQINTDVPIMVDASMSLYQTTINDGTVSGVIYPKEIQVINSTGCDLEYNFMANDNEYNDYLDDGTNYDFIHLPNETTLEDNNVMNRCKYFIVKKESGLATSDLRIDFINYVGFNIKWV